MSRLNVQLAASQAARKTLRTSLSQVTRRWQYWARVFGYSAPGLLTPPECEQWVLAEEQRSAPLTECAVVPRERLIQDPITLMVYDTKQFQPGWISIPPFAVPHPAAELQSMAGRQDDSELLSGAFCLTQRQGFRAPSAAEPMQRPQRRSLDAKQYDRNAPRAVSGQWIRDHGVWHKVYKCVQPVHGRQVNYEAIPLGSYRERCARQINEITLDIPLADLSAVPYWAGRNGPPLPISPDADYALYDQIQLDALRPGFVHEWDALPTSFSSLGVAVLDLGEPRQHWQDKSVMWQAIAETSTRADVIFMMDTEWRAPVRTQVTTRTGQRFRRGPAESAGQQEFWLQSVQSVLAPGDHVQGHKTTAVEVRSGAMRPSGEAVGMLVMSRSGRWITSVMDRQRALFVDAPLTGEGGRPVTLLSGRPEEWNVPQEPDAGADLYWVRVFHRHQKYRAARDAIDLQEKVVEDMSVVTLLFNQSGRVSARRALSVWAQFEREFRAAAQDGKADAPALILIHPDDAIVTLNAALRLHPRFTGRHDCQDRVTRFLACYGYSHSP